MRSGGCEQTNENVDDDDNVEETEGEVFVVNSEQNLLDTAIY